MFPAASNDHRSMGGLPASIAAAGSLLKRLGHFHIDKFARKRI
jgi:hypothetical protein